MRMIDIRTFVVLVRTRHFGRTAELLNTSQPAVSARIAALEKEFGSRLLERGRTFALTREGERALVAFETMLQTLEDLESDLAGTSVGPRVVKIGAIDTVAATFMPHMIDALHETVPSLRIELSVEGSNALLAGLADRVYDIVFAIDPAVGDNMRSFHSCMLEMVWVGAPGLVEAGRTYTVDELARLPIITFPKDTPPYRQIAPYFQDERVLAEKLTSTNSLFAIIALLLSGFGVGAVPVVTIARELASARLIPIDVAKPFPPLPVIASYQSVTHPALMALVTAEARRSAAAYCDALPDRSMWVA
ncbi:LysR family transcriptional regulator [Acuticoccus sediminis]|uniref:LysR family transcriptional regulator n=1 Tax=Acuticoccus sediminis TaxID=2184697 RepID=A0A8B2NIW2_9HYPH|nr:LysR family transcriptional regulator [Acuticoccus sediminis]RAH97451.1 LysR family transcriptional regulator [Acuticoccus sediminis]